MTLTLKILEDLSLSNRVYNNLSGARGGPKITTIEELLSCTPSQLLKRKDFGRNSLGQVEKELAKHGMHLAGTSNTCGSVIKRYVVFSFPSYYPTGGWGDFTDSFEDLEKAKEWCRKIETTDRFEYAQLIDLHTGEEIMDYAPRR
jgi:hypothetical protein